MVDIHASSPGDALSPEERQLHTLIMDYRAAHGLPAIPLSRALTTTAARHALDTVENQGGYPVGEPGEHPAHGWSDARYDGRDPATWPAMWMAPQRLGTGYPDRAYEISMGILGAQTPGLLPETALAAWQDSPAHDAVLLNRDGWARGDLRWQAIGIGIQDGVAHVWFGAMPDPTGPPPGGPADLPRPWLGTAGGDLPPAGNAAEYLCGLEGDDTLYGFGAGDRLESGPGADLLVGGSGDDRLDGGAGEDLAVFGGAPSAWRLAEAGPYLLAEGPDGADLLTGVEALLFDATGARLGLEALRAAGAVGTLGFARTETATGRAVAVEAMPYAGPVAGLVFAHLGTTAGEAVSGTAVSDFVNTLGGDDALAGGGGDDVLDGGTGSNFLTGGAGWDRFFADGRGGTIWTTVTDWEPGEQLSLWGWRPGVSRAGWTGDDGAAGYRGATLHADLDGDGAVETSLTWAGLDRAALATPFALDGLLWFQ